MKPFPTLERTIRRRRPPREPCNKRSSVLCYGINAAAKNDCAEGAHSCAGQATQARDPKSFVLLPAGDCAKIQGGKTTAN